MAVKQTGLPAEKEIQQLEESLGKLEAELHSRYCQLAKDFLSLAESEQAGINQLIDQIILTRQKLASARQENPCPHCLALNDQDSCFCKRCGHHLQGESR